MTLRPRIDDRRSGEDRRQDDDPQVSVRWSVVFQVVGYVVGLIVIYTAMTNRLTALETNRANDTLRLERVEAKIDRLLEREK